MEFFPPLKRPEIITWTNNPLADYASDFKREPTSPARHSQILGKLVETNQIGTAELERVDVTNFSILAKGHLKLFPDGELLGEFYASIGRPFDISQDTTGIYSVSFTEDKLVSIQRDIEEQETERLMIANAAIILIEPSKGDVIPYLFLNEAIVTPKSTENKQAPVPPYRGRGSSFDYPPVRRIFYEPQVHTENPSGK